jgi:aarF domain-containing kinase
MSRDQVRVLLGSLGLQNAVAPLLLPGAARSFLRISPRMTEDDDIALANVNKFMSFLLDRNAANRSDGSTDAVKTAQLARELLPLMPTVAQEVVPELVRRLVSRAGARLVREIYT